MPRAKNKVPFFEEPTFESIDFRKKRFKTCGKGRTTMAYPSFERFELLVSEKYHIMGDEMHLGRQKRS